jgi:hypothetical protein
MIDKLTYWLTKKESTTPIVVGSTSSESEFKKEY